MFIQENHEATSDLCKNTPTALLECMFNLLKVLYFLMYMMYNSIHHNSEEQEWDGWMAGGSLKGRKHSTIYAVIANLSTQAFHYCFWYDDAYHLKKYACNPSRRDCTETSKRLASLDIVVDKLHFRGHVDAWCHQNCDPYKIDQHKQVTTTYSSDHV